MTDQLAFLPGGRCRGCHGMLRIVDRATNTAKCERCCCEFDLRYNAPPMLPDYGEHPPYPRCVIGGCRAVLESAFVGDGDRCRYHAGEKPRAQERAA